MAICAVQVGSPQLCWNAETFQVTRGYPPYFQQMVGFGNLVGFEPHVKDPRQGRIYLPKCFASEKVLKMTQKAQS